jgi:hypothetical protein
MRTALRIGVNLAFGPVHQQRPSTNILKVSHARNIFGCDTLERRSAASSANGVASFASVRAVTHAHTPAHIQLLFQRRAQRPTGIYTG